MARQGLFVGLVTLDLVYLTSGPPTNNQKIVAADYSVAAGGPATNAAVTFAHLGGYSRLLGVVGSHPVGHLIHTDLAHYAVEITDLSSNYSEPPPVSSIIVTEATGERAIISLNARKSQAKRDTIPANLLQGVDIVLVDGHQIEVGQAIAELAQASNIPVVLDGGSWKPGLEKALPLVTYAICSADFCPPECHREQVLNYLASVGVSHMAITQGDKPIQYFSAGGTGELPVPQINPVDTVGAGDIFHGAFCHHILQSEFTIALQESAKVASAACESFGTRRWLGH